MLFKPTRTLLLALFPVLLLVLSACETATPPTLEPAAEITGLEFRVNPETEEVTVIEPDMAAASIASLQADGENRLLVQGEDIRFRNFSFQFSAPNKLVVLLNVENITDDLSFAQPFFFTLSSTSSNVVEAVAPLVTDAQLGGDGVLSPGETSEPFRFEVTFREDEPFAFFVEANALVEAASCSSPVSIPDEQLERAVRDALAQQEGELTCEDLASLETLSTVDVGIVTNLEGLQFAVNLSDLSFSGDDVSDLTPLADLTNLTALNFSNNSVSDLSPLENLTSLETLILAGNSVSNLTPLANLTSLTTLILNRNSVSDLTPLANLTNLTTLNLDDNSVSDLTPLVDLANLTSLNLNRNAISALRGLENLTSLDTLLLLGNDISDLSPLANLTSLIFLDLDSNAVSDITPLAGLTNLTTLDLRTNTISDISALLDNSGIGQGDSVVLFENPLSPQALEDIETLEARGVDVAF